MTNALALIGEIKANEKAYKADCELFFKTDGKEGGSMENPSLKNQKLRDSIFELAKQGDQDAIKFCRKQFKAKCN